jgi:hypothetical protein
MSEIMSHSTDNRMPPQRKRRAIRHRHRLDRRLKTARRAAELVMDYMRRLGITPTSEPAIHSTCTRLAELVAIGEAQRAQLIRGESVDLLGLIRLENSARRLMRDLGIAGPPPPPPLPSLAELLSGGDGE